MNNASAIQIVGTHFQCNTIPRKKTDIVHSHPPRNMRQHFVPVFKPHPKRGAWKRFDHFPFNANNLFVFVRTHSTPWGHSLEMRNNAHATTLLLCLDRGVYTKPLQNANRRKETAGLFCRRRIHKRGTGLLEKSFLMLAFLPHVDPNVSVLITYPSFSRALSILANGLFFVNSAPKQCQYTPIVYENMAQTQGYSQFSTVVRPLKERLPLTRATREIARSTMPHHLRNVPPHRSPPSNLSRIIPVPATTIVSAIPLKPPARIIRVNPSFLSPHRERLTRINPKVIQLWIAFAGCEFRMRKPMLRKFLRTVSHVHPAKHTERKHIFRRKIGCKRRIKMLPLRFGEFVLIVALHSIVNRNARSHKNTKNLFHSSKYHAKEKVLACCFPTPKLVQ